VRWHIVAPRSGVAVYAAKELFFNSKDGLCAPARAGGCAATARRGRAGARARGAARAARHC
jgi:hypothetical protein